MALSLRWELDAKEELRRAKVEERFRQHDAMNEAIEAELLEDEFEDERCFELRTKLLKVRVATISVPKPIYAIAKDGIAATRELEEGGEDEESEEDEELFQEWLNVQEVDKWLQAIDESEQHKKQKKQQKKMKKKKMVKVKVKVKEKPEDKTIQVKVNGDDEVELKVTVAVPQDRSFTRSNKGFMGTVIKSLMRKYGVSDAAGFSQVGGLRWLAGAGASGFALCRTVWVWKRMK